MATFSSVSCQEVHGSRREQFSYSSQSASVQLRCAWSDVYDLAEDLLDGFGRPYPYMSNLYVRDVTIEPEKGQYTESSQGMVYEFGLVTVQYGVSGMSGGGDQPDPGDPLELASETIEPTSTFLTLNPGFFRWSGAVAPNDALTQDEAPGAMIKGLLLSRTLFRITSIPAKVLDVGGTINDRPYTSRITGLTFDAQTLLCNPPKLSRSITTAGVGAWTVACSWEHKPEGWNWFYRGSVDAYTQLVLRSTGNIVEIYKPFDQRPFLPG